MFKTNEKTNEGIASVSREVKDTSVENKETNKKVMTSTTNNTVISKNSTISEGIKIKGEVTGSNNIDVYGNVEGSINLGGNDINIENTADIKADIVGKVVRVNGKVIGNIEAKDKILVTSNGNVKGDIKAPKVELQDGSYFDGNIAMGRGNANTSNNNATTKNITNTNNTEKTTNNTNSTVNTQTNTIGGVK